jgi:signal transduction histidine kinase
MGLPRVLLVDDRPSNLRALEALLAPLNCEIVLAETGEVALQLLLTEQFSVILLDVQLPGLDGFEVAGLIKQRERTRHIPIIFLTAQTERDSAVRGYAVGAVDYVSKPFEPTVLQSKVRSFIELSQAHEQLRLQTDELAAMLAEREATTALLNEQADELRRSNAELEHLAAMASHELSEPLRVIAGYSELLSEGAEESGDEDTQAITAAISRGVARMQRLIDGILAYARAGAAVPLEKVPLVEVVAEVLLSLEAMIDDRQAQVRVGDLPVVEFNRTQLTQILQNLISNAIKFVPPGRPATVEVTAEELPDAWRLSVADNGMGVSEDERERIFDMFSRRLAGDGFDSGIGLAVCARIVQRAGGTLDVAPAPEGGSVFTVTIPVGRDEGDVPASSARTHGPDPRD